MKIAVSDESPLRTSLEESRCFADSGALRREAIGMDPAKSRSHLTGTEHQVARCQPPDAQPHAGLPGPVDPALLPPSNDHHSDHSLEDGNRGKRLRRCVADRWNGLDAADKASVIGGVAVALVGGFIALSTTHAPVADSRYSRDDTADPFDSAADYLGPADISAPGRDASGGWSLPYRLSIGDYWRNSCSNPRGHATGNCEHVRTLVPAHTKGPADKPFKGDEA